MLSPVELSLAPSCEDCLAWSPDGELAIAAGDSVQILTPRFAEHGKQESGSSSGWHITRFRTNLFTHQEWPSCWPQNRDDFSIAAEQSPSTVRALAWSPPGLGRFRRSVLAVLTSNLVLSLYEPLGPRRQWTKVGIVNHSLRNHFSPSEDPNGLALRKCLIRSFIWCPSLKIPASDTDSMLDSESRWGVQMLAVSNDHNDVIILQVHRSAPVSSYSIELLGLRSPDAPGSQYSTYCPGSILENALQTKQRVISVSCGPWIASPETNTDNAYAATSLVVMVYGSQLRMMKVTAALKASDTAEPPIYNMAVDVTAHPLSSLAQTWHEHHFTGLLHWVPMKADFALAASVNAGYFTIHIPHSVYGGNEKKLNQTKARGHPLYESTTSEGVETQSRHLEPISAMTSLSNERTHTSTLHLGTLGGLCFKTTIEKSNEKVSAQFPQWRKTVEDLRERFDLNHDLSGWSVARIWGLTSRRNVIAALFTRHGTDMVEYKVSADDRAMLIFSTEDGEHEEDSQALFAPTIPQQETVCAREKRESATQFVLRNYDDDQPHGQRLVYAAACSAIIDQQSDPTRAQARQALEHLTLVTGADLSDEISKSTSPGAQTISAKSPDQLDGPGAHLFERCEVCDAGVAWYSSQEAQCANGHLFVRCGLTSLAIQEPGISKYCSWCHTEYFDEEVLACTRADDLGQMHRRMFAAFDTCLYCGGKFQASI
ncbi:Transcription factor IIIC zinc-finger [Penicillium riverlandense]|uniref:Transcription factor IIIC zinc-finger n=1 Tax=Penicillium riverlandense TaxID=1903569 RepID=UPI0025479CDD|nr:Transcription factor IIIC zinc-finger [Penicillium riverlandense]KAJ5814527.1 Transcription factor IIIC zinc-finger [Penicillium riverlandense]